MKIIIGGDVAPAYNNFELFKDKTFFDKLDPLFKEKWLAADYRIFNLETPLGDQDKLSPIDKSGPNLLAPSDCIKGIKSLQPSLICLANNHTLDYGKEGLENTISIIENHGIKTTGTISNTTEKIKPVYFEKDGIKVGIYNLCEKEFNSATKNGIGSNIYREDSTLAEIESAKKKCNCLIVVYHAGKEYYRYPSPALKERCESFVDAGADFVACQHSHCLGCKQDYKKATIIYGQGNFIFTYRDNEYWRNGSLIEIEIKKGKTDTHYILLQKDGELIKVAEDQKPIEDFFERSKEIAENPDIVQDNYDKFCEKMLDNYITMIKGRSLYSRIYHKFFKKFPQKDYNKKYYLDLLNTLQCEAHRELVENGLKNRIKNRKGE